ncbi:MAG: STAS/SEC14 domain-containing protein [Gammaproteobacteria bacterium]|nr:STAS/SEC14 domain-containing protein [Gammaproteobacteria bacterium]
MVVSVARGALSLADLRAHRDFVDNHVAYDPSLGLLFDLRRVSQFALTPDDVRNHAGFGAVGMPRFRRIGILVEDDLAYGMSRVFQAYTNNRYADDSIRVIREAAGAWQWVRGQAI